MTNEEKAKKITDGIFELGFNANRTYYDMAKNAAMDMAEWKDEQWRLRAQTAFCASRGCMFQCGTTMCDARIAFDRLISQ